MHAHKYVLNGFLLINLLNIASAKTLPNDDFSFALYSMLAANFAIESQELDKAAQFSIQALRTMPSDAELARESTEIAVLSNKTELMKEAFRTWGQLEGKKHSYVYIQVEAFLAIKNQQWRKAKQYLGILLSSPDSRDWNFATMTLLPAADQKDPSQRLLIDLIDTGSLPNRYDMWIKLGQYASAIGNVDLERHVIRAMIIRFPNDYLVGLLYSRRLWSDGANAKAFSVLRHLEPNAIHNVAQREKISNTYYELGEPQNALRILATGPQNISTYTERFKQLALQNNTNGLSSLYQQIYDDDQLANNAKYQILAQICSNLKDYSKALFWIQKIPQSSWDFNLKAQKIFLETVAGNYLKAINALQSLQDEIRTDDQMLRWFELKTDISSQRKEYAAVSASLEDAIELFPDNIALLYNYSLSLELEKKITEAQAQLYRILELDPTNTMALNSLGYILSEHTTNYTAALKFIERALVNQPNNPLILDSYGWVLFKMGKIHQAEEILLKTWHAQKFYELASHLEAIYCTQKKYSESHYYAEQAKKLFDATDQVPITSITHCNPN